MLRSKSLFQVASTVAARATNAAPGQLFLHVLTDWRRLVVCAAVREHRAAPIKIGFSQPLVWADRPSGRPRAPRAFASVAAVLHTILHDPGVLLWCNRQWAADTVTRLFRGPGAQVRAAGSAAGSATAGAAQSGAAGGGAGAGARAGQDRAVPEVMEGFAWRQSRDVRLGTDFWWHDGEIDCVESEDEWEQAAADRSELGRVDVGVKGEDESLGEEGSDPTDLVRLGPSLRMRARSVVKGSAGAPVSAGGSSGGSEQSDETDPLFGRLATGHSGPVVESKGVPKLCR